MKKVLMVGCVLLLLLLGAACGKKKEEGGNQIKDTSLSYDDRKTNEVMLQIWNSIEKKDRDTFISMFSQTAMDNIENFDSKVDEFLDYFSEEILEVERVAGSSAKSQGRYGVIYELGGSYEIKTEKEVYKLKFKYILRDDTDKEEAGMQNIKIYPVDMPLDDVIWGKDMDIVVNYWDGNGKDDSSD